MITGSPSPQHPYAALSHRAFRLFLGSLLTMTVGAQVQAVIVGWEVYHITRDPLSLGMLGLAEVVPYISVALFAGYVVDRGDRRAISIRAMAVLLLAAIVLWLMTAVTLESRHVWPFYAVLSVCGLARSFLQTSRSALIAEILPRELLPRAAIWRSSTWQLGTVLGPALGGVLLAAFGTRTALGINVAITATALVSMTLVRHTPTVLSTATASIRRNLADGLRYVRNQRVILGALSLDMIAVFFGGAIALFPIFASDILGVGPRGFGALQAAPGLGAVATALIIAHRRPFRRAGRALLIAVTVFGVAIIGFALSRSFVFSIAMLVVSGAADNVSAVIRATMIQVLVPPEMLGRVSAVNAIFIGSSNELGAFESGVAARLLGVVPSVVFGGAMTLATVGVVGRKLRELRTLGEIRAS
jgi:MFS family permease